MARQAGRGLAGLVRAPPGPRGRAGDGSHDAARRHGHA